MKNLATWLRILHGKRKEKLRLTPSETDKFIFVKQNAAITSIHASITKLSSSMLRLCKQRKLFWREKFRDSSVKHTV